jgi:hypothetical protein
MRERLAGILSGYDHIFTHNPWGEYGHEEHVQVHNVICELQEKARYNIWYDGYCSTRTLGMIDPASCAGENMQLKTERNTAEELMKMYETAGCWTWHKDWAWPFQETFFKKGDAFVDPKNARLVNLNVIVLAPLYREDSKPQLNVYRRLKTLARGTVKKMVQRFERV